MRIRDWSSGVCSSDLISTPAWIVRPTLVDRLVPGTEGSWTARRSCPRVRGPPLPRRVVAASRHLRGQRDGCRRPPGQLPLLDQRVPDRKSGVQGKSVSVRGDHGGLRIIQQNTKINDVPSYL